MTTTTAPDLEVDVLGLDDEAVLAAVAVREFAVTDLAVTLELSEHSARAYVAQAVELRDRLPRL